MLFDSSNLGTLTQYWEAGVAIIAMAIWLIINMVTAWRFSRKSPIATRLSSLLLIIIGLTTIHFTVNKWQSEWEGTLPGGRGTVTNLIMSGYQTAYHPLTMHKVQTTLSSKSQSCVVLPETQTEVKPDIVVLLQESTVNPTIYQFDKNVDLPDLFYV